MAADKPSDPQEGSFFSRWSQRKQALRKGELPPQDAAPAQSMEQAAPISKPLAAAHLAGQGDGKAQGKSRAQGTTASTGEPAALPPAPTMQDVHQLTAQSDFKPFMRSDVPSDVKNAAMKQLFKDPHFNTMDMMDIYVDDYSKSDPLPADMLRKMAVTKFLGFWDEEEKLAAQAKAREDADHAVPENVAQSSPEASSPLPPEITRERASATSLEAVVNAEKHDHPDLQLQPDDAAGHQGALKSAG